MPAAQHPLLLKSYSRSMAKHRLPRPKLPAPGYLCALWTTMSKTAVSILKDGILRAFIHTSATLYGGLIHLSPWVSENSPYRKFREQAIRDPVNSPTSAALSQRKQIRGGNEAAPVAGRVGNGQRGALPQRGSASQRTDPQAARAVSRRSPPVG